MAKIHWLHDLSGSFTNIADWSSGAVPAGSDDATLDAPGSTPYTVSASAGVTVKGIETAKTATLDVTGGTFFAEGGTDGGGNAGTIAVKKGATFEVAGTVSNTGVVLVADGGAIHLGSPGVPGETPPVPAVFKGGAVSIAVGGKVFMPVVYDRYGNPYKTPDLFEPSTLENAGLITMGYGITLTVGGVIDNSGTILVNNGSRSTSPDYHDISLLNLAANTTLTGKGDVVVSENGFGFIGVFNKAKASLINTDNTISGGGIVGESVSGYHGYAGYINLTNQAAGVIDANGTDTLRLQTGAFTNAGLAEDTGAGGLGLYGSIVNSGTLLAAGTGGLYFHSGGSVTNTGRIEAIGSAPINIDRTTVTDGVGGSIGPVTAMTIQSGGIVATSLSLLKGGLMKVSGTDLYPTILQTSTLTNQGEIDVGTPTLGGGVLSLQHLVDNIGVIKVAASYGYGEVIVSAAGVTLTGGGQVELSDNAQNIIGVFNKAKASLINTDNTISGGGVVGESAGYHSYAGYINLTNQAAGVIDANGTNALRLQTGVLTNAGLAEDTGAGGLGLYGSIVNSGTLLAAGTGGLYFHSGGLVTNTGRIEAIGSAPINIDRTTVRDGVGGSIGPVTAMTIQSGGIVATSLSLLKGGLMDVTGTDLYPTILQTSTLINQGEIDVGTPNLGSGVLSLQHLVDNIGVIKVGAAATSSSYGGIIVSAAGVTLTGGGQVELSDNSQNTIGASTKVKTSLINTDNTISGAGSVGIYGHYIGYVNLTNQAAGVIDANGNNALRITGDLTNAGLAEDTGAGGLGLYGSVVNSGTLLAAGSGGLYFHSGSITNLGAILTSGAGSLRLNVPITNAGLVEVAGSAGVSIAQDIVNSGRIVAAGAGGITISGTTISNSGGMIVAQNASNADLEGVTLIGGTLETSSGGMVTLDGASAGAVSTQGTIGIANGAAVTAEGGIVNTGTIAFGSTGLLTELTVANAGLTLSGGGSVTLSDNIDNKIVGVSTAATFTNLDNTISGAGEIGGASLTLVNDAAGTIDANASVQLIIDTAGKILANDGLMKATGAGGLYIRATTVDGSGGGTIAAVGGPVEFQGVDIVGGTLRSVGATFVHVQSGANLLDGTVSTVTVAGRVVINDGQALTLQGSIANSSVIVLNSDGTATSLTVGASGATLTGGGSVYLDPHTQNLIGGATATATLTNDDNVISGAGDLGGGKLTLVNGAKGVIYDQFAVALTIDTGTNIISNAGLIEGVGTGGVTIKGAVDNTGILKADGGNLTVIGAVTDSGRAVIDGGTLTFDSTFSQNVAFTGGTSELILARSQGFAATIAGFSKTGASTLDLEDIAFGAKTTAKFAGTSASGVLTVTDGTHTARMTLQGNYLSSAFTASSDGHGGTTIVDPAAPSRRPGAGPLHSYIAAAASFGPVTGGAAGAHGQIWRTPPPMLARPGTQIA